MKVSVSILIAAICCAGCNATSNYAANQVLGSRAEPVDPRVGWQIKAGGVYEFRGNGKPIAHCDKDFQKNKALSGVKIEVTESSSDSKTDQIGLEGLSIGVPGIPTLRVPYDKSRIVGYRVTSASVEGQSYQDFVYNGVSKKCRSLIDAGAIVVAKEARAEKTVRLMRGPIAGRFGVGLVEIGGVDTELSVSGPNNVTFGIVKASQE